MSAVENEIVNKHNKLIEFKGRMTVLEQKLLATVISKITSEDKDFKEYRIYISEIQDYLDTTHKDIYSQLKETARSLRKREIQIEQITKNNKSFLVTGWISSARYVDGEGYIVIYIDPLLKPYLLDLSGTYKGYQLKNILKLKGTHSIRIYELLKQYEKIGYRQFEILELKEILGIENLYSRFFDFEKRVLEPAKEDINTQTDLIIDYEKIKIGRRIKKIKFTIIGQINKEKQMIETLYDNEQIEGIKLACGIADMRINAVQVTELYEIAVKKTESVDISPYKYIRLNYKAMIDKGMARNKYAYLKKSLEEDYAKAVLQIKYTEVV